MCKVHFLLCYRLILKFVNRCSHSFRDISASHRKWISTHLCFFCSICVILTTYMRKKTLQGCFYVEHVQLYCLWLYSYYMYMYMQNEIQKISTDWTKQIPWAYAYSPIHPLGTEGLNQQLERRAGLHLTHGILLTVSHHVELCPGIILWHNSWDPPDCIVSCSVT